ncbi:unnamed protein product [Prorocentrum cordatum]|uniref:Cupin 2 conserved barrel domain-containing protein n=1 Tax=Prorocentrum cordatum TaxID=2364126 RepID=A0ABN9XJP6_9DINO|nr:unnamed protein product [Polarella glacialis]|mmetsp:Transcript_81247/g.230185  ORF Transcript_81247/g.230185 Transcript_81247/m.230185 type:complete len:138 (+) Transcript_81247:108-521(+)
MSTPADAKVEASSQRVRRLVRVCHDAATGDSRFDDEAEVAMVEKMFAPPAPSLFASDKMPVSNFLLVETLPGWGGDVAHPTPAKQYCMCLRGGCRITVSDGESREFGVGDVWLLDDTEGKGHVTHTPTESLFAMVQV